MSGLSHMSEAAEPLLPKDFERIIALPRRLIIDCERERGVRRWAPEATGLVEVMTEKYSLGLRLSCACRDRHVVARTGGAITIFQKGRPNTAPPLPTETTIDAFCRDAAHDEDAVKIVSGLHAGQSVDLVGLGHPACLTELNPVQAWTLYELPRAGGIFGMVSTGGGKSILGILTPLAMPQLKTWILLIKPDQRLHYQRNYLWLREHFRVPSIVFDARYNPRKTNLKGSYWVDGAPTLHVVPYSVLSNPKSTMLLESIDADGVVADECHLLANPLSARTVRFLRFMSHDESKFKVFCNWSGSTVKKSMRDCSHLAAHALGLGSPYPIDSDEVDRWAQVIDPVNIPDTKSFTAKRLRKQFGGIDENQEEAFLGGKRDAKKVREGHRDQIVETLGVISTRSSSVTASISIMERIPPKMPPAVKDALKMVRAGQRPDTEELADQKDVTLCARHVAAGFYFRWIFPKHSDEERAEGGLVSKWFAARKAFHKELRVKLLEGAPHLDSPLLCSNAAERAWRKERYKGDLPVWPAETWPTWVAIKDKVEYEPKTTWIDEFLARDAAEWAKEHCGVVWCQSSSFGRKIAALAGINYHGGGSDAEERIMAEDGKRSIVASIPAHGTGRDTLQFKFREQLVAEHPSSGDLWEQLLARLCRPGQEAETIDTWVYRHVSENRDAFRKAYELAQFIEATTPNRQLLLAANIDFEI